MSPCRDWATKNCSRILRANARWRRPVYIIKRDTRHFAKRQLTWFRREKDVIWLNKPDFDYDEEKILSYMLDRWNEIVSADAKEEGEQSC